MSNLGFDIKERDFVPDEFLISQREREEIYKKGKEDAHKECIQEIAELVSKQMSLEGFNKAMDSVEEWAFKYCQDNKTGSIPFTKLMFYINDEKCEEKALLGV